MDPPRAPVVAIPVLAPVPVLEAPVVGGTGATCRLERRSRPREPAMGRAPQSRPVQSWGRRSQGRPPQARRLRRAQGPMEPLERGQGPCCAFARGALAVRARPRRMQTSALRPWRTP